MAETKQFGERVEISIENHVAKVEMVREDKLNALDPAMFDALIDAAGWLREKPRARVVVLCGRGRMFCAGLDFGSFAAMANPGEERPQSLEDRTHGVANKPQYAAYAWHELPIPVIVAIQGGALGGGLQIALAADIRIAAPDAKIAIAETQWGLVPDMSGNATVRRLVRDDILRQLTYTAERIDGVRAQSVGLVTEIHEDPLARAMAIATQVAGRSPSAIRGSKALLNTLDDGTSESILLAESREQQAIIGKPHQVEAVMANLEKREPVFD
ncbi:crotonase/enoyl-CoA hydratase family protein [Maricaulis sp.]|uniref:crotonase/enoyl-CoA hydratase family protein n=1 Tax=Maricaulis sp. TaxID=1486257 RepID=UPI0026087B3E|nr:crotonase/enoyl-CoA hydratase family protein [Maricaulis sp.]